MWGHIALWGDLRDFGQGDVQQIRDWWKFLHQALEIADLSVRNGVLSIEVERGAIEALHSPD
jgi:hypothetical protein